MKIHPIARIKTDFHEKFGIPRQSGLAGSLEGYIVFEPAYRDPEALRGLDGFSYLWLIWEFSANAARDANGSLPYALQGLAVMNVWECLPPVLLSGRIQSDFHALKLTVSSMMCLMLQ